LQAWAGSPSFPFSRKDSTTVRFQENIGADGSAVGGFAYALLKPVERD
jgi:hypothetical protein